MSVVTQMVLMLSGEFLTSVPPGGVVISRVDCVSMCYRDPRCRSIFYNTGDDTCILTRSVYSQEHMDSYGPNMQYLVWQKEYRDCRLDYSLASSLDMCYKIYNSPSTWQMALDQCHQDGGHLIKADNEEITDFFKSYTCNTINDDRFWVGGQLSSDKWLWGDNSSVIWDDDDVHVDETCMQIKCADNNLKIQLEDKNCELMYKYICETAVEMTVYKC